MSVEDYEWMFCTQCRQTVVRNDNGICLACQRAYTEEEQPDSWRNIRRREADEEIKLSSAANQQEKRR